MAGYQPRSFLPVNKSQEAVEVHKNAKRRKQRVKSLAGKKAPPSCKGSQLHYQI